MMQTVTLTMIVLAGLMGASGIVLAAAAAHAASGAGLDGAAYMLLFHAAALLGGVALLEQRVLQAPLMLVVLPPGCWGAPCSPVTSVLRLSSGIASLHWRRRAVASSSSLPGSRLRPLPSWL